MKDLFDSSETRRTLRIINEVDNDFVYLIAGAAFFAQRTAKMLVKRSTSEQPLFSEAVLNQLLDNYPNAVYIVCLTSEYECFREKLNHSRILIHTINEDQIGQSQTELINLLKKTGIRLLPIKNPRTVSYLNIYKFVNSTNFKVINSDDYAALKINPEKELSFADMAKQRAQNSFF